MSNTVKTLDTNDKNINIEPELIGTVEHNREIMRKNEQKIVSFDPDIDNELECQVTIDTACANNNVDEPCTHIQKPDDLKPYYTCNGENHDRPFIGAIVEYNKLLAECLDNAKLYLSQNPNHLYAKVKIPLFKNIEVECSVCNGSGSLCTKIFPVHSIHYGPLIHYQFDPNKSHKLQKWQNFFNRSVKIWSKVYKYTDTEIKYFCSPFRRAQIELFDENLYLFDWSNITYNHSNDTYWYKIDIRLYRQSLDDNNGLIYAPCPVDLPHGYGDIPGLQPLPGHESIALHIQHEQKSKQYKNQKQHQQRQEEQNQRQEEEQKQEDSLLKFVTKKFRGTKTRDQPKKKYDDNEFKNQRSTHVPYKPGLNQSDINPDGSIKVPHVQVHHAKKKEHYDAGYYVPNDQQCVNHVLGQIHGPIPGSYAEVCLRKENINDQKKEQKQEHENEPVIVVDKNLVIQKEHENKIVIVVDENLVIQKEHE